MSNNLNTQVSNNLYTQVSNNLNTQVSNKIIPQVSNNLCVLILGHLRLGHIGALHSSGFFLGSLLADLLVHRERVGGGGSVSPTPSPLERPSSGLNPGLSYRMNELVHRLARLRDSEEAHEEDEQEEEGLVGPSSDPEELGNSCPGAA